MAGVTELQKLEIRTNLLGNAILRLQFLCHCTSLNCSLEYTVIMLRDLQSREEILENGLEEETTGFSKQRIRTRYLGHVTGYQPIREQYFLIRSVPTHLI